MQVLSKQTLRSVQTLKAAPILLLAVLAWIASRRKLRTASRDAGDERPWADGNGTSSGTRELWVPYKDKLRQVTVYNTKESTFDAHARLFVKRGKSAFLSELWCIFSIILPRINTKVTGFLALQMTLLTLRTYLSLVVARLDGRIIKAMVAAQGREFLKGIASWLLLAVPASYTNAMISYLNGRIALEFRTKLVRYIHDLYLQNENYYKLANIDGTMRADHFIATDVTRFSNAAASLYSNLGKPTVDIFLFCYQLSQNLGTAAFFGILVNYAITASFLKRVAPPFGRLAAQETNLEGEYRNAHARIITNAEEIAFYDGASIERASLLDSFKAIYAHTQRLLRARSGYWIVEDMVLKYSWSASGFLFASIPVFFPSWVGAAAGATAASATSSATSSASASASTSARMGTFITNKRLMLSLSDAGGRLMYSIKDLAELAGYTQRVYGLLTTLHRIRRNAYEGGELTLGDVRGTRQLNYDGLRLENVPVVVPGLGCDESPGEPLLDPITLNIKAGEHLLITGPNGSGKTSIARIAAGLWPVFRGLLSAPSDLTFLPQRPYFVRGSLRDQVIYPQTHAAMLAAGRTDDDLAEILKAVSLDYLPAREGGWNTTKEWKDVLSGGEKQRMLFARILYAKPSFAFIDEGTAAVSQDMEGQMYEQCKHAGVTLVTISHRISLLKYHKCLLKVGLGDDGSKWEFTRTADNKTVKDEIASIKSTLARVEEMKARRAEVAELLGLKEHDGPKKS